MSGRTDDVAALRKWQDRIRKEMKFTESRAAGEFHINPHALKPVTHKIGEVEKKAVSLEETARREKDIAELRETIASVTKTPQEKFRKPMTASQEVGWYWKESEVVPSRATHPMSEEVKYAKAYFDTFHCGPYSKTQTVAR